MSIRYTTSYTNSIFTGFGPHCCIEFLKSNIFEIQTSINSSTLFRKCFRLSHCKYTSFDYNRRVFQAFSLQTKNSTDYWVYRFFNPKELYVFPRFWRFSAVWIFIFILLKCHDVKCYPCKIFYRKDESSVWTGALFRPEKTSIRKKKTKYNKHRCTISSLRSESKITSFLFPPK